MPTETRLQAIPVHRGTAAPARRAFAVSLSGRAGAAAVAAMVAVMFMGSTLLTPLYALYQRNFGFSVIGLTLLYSVYVVGNLTALLFFGRLSDQIGRRRVILPAVLLAGVSTALFLFAAGPAWLFGARTLSGFAIGLASGSGAAWIAELIASADRTNAATMMTATNFAGLTLGPVVAGALAQYAPWPLRLPYLVYLVLLVAVALAVGATRETAKPKAAVLSRLSLRPRLGVPAAIRARFIAPAISVFGLMALVGFYAVLAPTIIIRDLHQTNLAVGAAVVATMFLVTALAILATRRLSSRAAMLGGLGLMPPALAMLVWAQADRSMPLFLIGAVLGGVSAALSYRGSLQVVNDIAPKENKAEVVSTYFVAAFSGNALPVIGFGVVSAVWNGAAASIAFAATLAVFAVAALAVDLKLGRSEGR